MREAKRWEGSVYAQRTRTSQRHSWLGASPSGCWSSGDLAEVVALQLSLNDEVVGRVWQSFPNTNSLFLLGQDSRCSRNKVTFSFFLQFGAAIGQGSLLKGIFKHQSNSSTVMPMEEPWPSYTCEGSDTTAAWPTVTIRDFSISRDVKTWENVYLRTDDSVCWRERQRQKITIYRVRRSLTYLHNLGWK